MVITEKGFIVPTFEEIYKRKLNDFKTVKPDIRETDSNLIISFLKFDAIEEYDSYMQGLTMFNNLSAYTATDSYLNAITSHLNMTWLDAKKSVGKIKITANNGTVIPQAWGVETKSGIKFVTLNTNSVTVTNNEIVLNVQSLNAGRENNVTAGSITEQTEVLEGVISVVNENNTYKGTDKETDTELRERYFKAISQRRSFNCEGIKTYILENTNVVKCQVLENDTDETDSDGRLAHSYECICFGDTDENIFKALYDYKVAGIRTVGQITKNFGEISVGFTRATEKEIFAKVEIQTIKDIWKEDYKKDIERIYINYINTIEPAGAIYLYKIIGEIYKNVNVIKTLKIKLGDVKYSEREADFFLTNKEVAIANKESLTFFIE